MIRIQKPYKRHPALNGYVFMVSKSPWNRDEVYGAQYTLYAHKPRTREQLFELLHELGHIADSTAPRNPSSLTHVQRLNHEILAWGYALRCTQVEYHPYVLNFALLCLRTYDREGVVSNNELMQRVINSEDHEVFTTRPGPSQFEYRTQQNGRAVQSERKVLRWQRQIRKW